MIDWLKNRYPEPWHTWTGHALITLFAAIVTSILAVVLDQSGSPHIAKVGGLFGALYAVAYFLYREQRDKERHIKRGTYDRVVNGVSPRADRAGDLLGPIAILVGIFVGILL